MNRRFLLTALNVRYSAFVAVICLAIYAVSLPIAAENLDGSSGKPASAPSVPLCVSHGLSPCAELSSKPASAPSLPIWAYPYTPVSGPAEDENTPKHVPGSTVTYTLKQIHDSFNSPDWHPEDHPPLPEVVAHGRKASNVKPCGRCHLVSGQGRPENGANGGLPVAYFLRQVREFQKGLRTSSDMRRVPPTDMIASVRNMSDEDLEAAAEYFAGMKFKPWTRVVECNTIPRPQFLEAKPPYHWTTFADCNTISTPEWAGGGGFIMFETGEREPIGERIIEVPENIERSEWRDTHSGFIAYVPEGSIKKGEELFTTGGDGKTMQCGVCHGQDLRGKGNAPPIAGRSATYIFRQLNDFQNGARHGEFSPQMKGVVGRLSHSDMLALAAYVASRTP